MLQSGSRLLEHKQSGSRIFILGPSVFSLKTFNWFSWGPPTLLEKEMATHSNILAWKTSWTVEPGRLQCMGLQRIRHDWATNIFTRIVKSNLFYSKSTDWNLKNTCTETSRLVCDQTRSTMAWPSWRIKLMTTLPLLITITFHQGWHRSFYFLLPDELWPLPHHAWPSFYFIFRSLLFYVEAIRYMIPKILILTN